MTHIETGETPSRTLTWKPLVFLSHIKCRTNDDFFSVSQWEYFFFSRFGVSTPALIGPDQQCVCNAFSYDTFGDHLQTCKTKSVDSQVHDWVVYKLGKPQTQNNRLPPPRTLIMDFTMTHVRFGCSHFHRMGQLTNTIRSDGAPDPDGSLKKVSRIKIRQEAHAECLS